MKKALSLILVLAMVATLFCGCGKTDPGKETIGLLMPTQEQTIWSIQAKRLKEAYEAQGYAVEIEYAEDDSAKQVMQIENMITKKVKAMVIVAVDCAALTECCEKAKKAGIIVISEDRLITNTEAVDFYVTFDLVRMGEIQGQYIVDALKLEEAGDKTYTLEIFSGSQDDTNAISFYNGAMNKLKPYLDKGTLKVESGQVSYEQTAILGWDSSKAQTRMDNLLSGFYSDKHLDAVLVAADCLAIGVISSLETMHYGTEANPFPVITGQDAELAAVKNIMAGKQSMTAFLDAKKLAEIIVPVTTSLIKGEKVEADTTYNNGKFDVPTKTYDPLQIDKTNYNYLVEIGYFTDAEING